MISSRVIRRRPQLEVRATSAAPRAHHRIILIGKLRSHEPNDKADSFVFRLVRQRSMDEARLMERHFSNLQFNINGRRLIYVNAVSQNVVFDVCCVMRQDAGAMRSGYGSQTTTLAVTFAEC